MTNKVVQSNVEVMLLFSTNPQRRGSSLHNVEKYPKDRLGN